MRNFAIILALAVLGGCASPLTALIPQGDIINEGSLAATVTAAKLECGRSPMVRKAYLDAINQRLALSVPKITVTALDCNGDGKPDF